MTARQWFASWWPRKRTRMNGKAEECADLTPASEREKLRHRYELIDAELDKAFGKAPAPVEAKR